MASLNIYLPEALKAEMDSLEGINWSNVAQQAIRETINREKARSTMDIAAVATRLRGTGGKNSTAYKRGHEEGTAWASADAELDDLEVVDGFNLEYALHESGGDPVQAANELARLMGAEDARYLFEDGSLITPSRLRGFVEGALEIFRAARPQL